MSRKNDYKTLVNRAFRDATAQIESSGGKNFKHKKMGEDSIHAGDSAIGTYGIMPNTIKEFSNRYPNWEPYQQVKDLSSSEMKASIEADPELEQDMVEPMADFVLEKYGSPRKANYAWEQGHNLDPEIVDNNFMWTDRDRKFQKAYRPPMQPESMEAKDRQLEAKLLRMSGDEPKEMQKEQEDTSDAKQSLANLRKMFTRP